VNHVVPPHRRSLYAILTVVRRRSELSAKQKNKEKKKDNEEEEEEKEQSICDSFCTLYFLLAKYKRRKTEVYYT
jgi:hypothetical protein